MWFKVHRNVYDIRNQIIAFIKKHIIILFTHISIFMTKRAALLCTISNVCIRVYVVGSQTIAAYSRVIRSSINSWTSTETYTSDPVTAESEVNIGSSRRGPIMTLSEIPFKELIYNVVYCILLLLTHVLL
jgi:hypothetical protein